MRLLTCLLCLTFASGLIVACDKDAAETATEPTAPAAETPQPETPSAEAPATEAAAPEATEENAKVATAEVAAAEVAAAPNAAKGSTCGSSCGSDCPFHDVAGKPKADSVTPTAANHYGAPFSVAEAKPLAKTIADWDETSTNALKVSGAIKSVCKKKGCWMVIQDGEVEARITMRGYGFTVPVDSKGSAVVEGVLRVKTFTEAQVKHLEEDAGRDPSKVSGTRKEYLLVANGVEITS